MRGAVTPKDDGQLNKATYCTPYKPSMKAHSIAGIHSMPMFWSATSSSELPQRPVGPKQ